MSAPGDNALGPDAERHARLGDVLNRALQLPAPQRPAFLTEACEGDGALEAEVFDLLEGWSDAEGDALSISVEFPLHDDMLVTPRANREGSDADIPGYRLIREIGRGGMGTVHEAEQLKPHRRVALKILRPLSSSSDAVGRFRREAQLLARLQHPGICQVLESGETSDRRPWLSMEYIEGLPLTTAARSADWSQEERIRVLERICSAVGHAHGRGIVHRDLKPDNVLVTADGEPKILDFGIARAVESGATMFTQTGTVVGTLTYMSPEQAAGESKVTQRSDVYSLGILGFELLTGRLPMELDGLSLREALHVIQDSDLSMVGRSQASLQGDIETILGKALDPDPQRRYASATDFAEDLRRHLSHEPVAARRPSVTYRARKFARRHRTMVLAVTAVFAALSIGLGVAVQQAIEAERRASEATIASYRASAAMLLKATEQSGLSSLADQLPALDSPARGWEAEHVDQVVASAFGHLVTEERFITVHPEPHGRSFLGLLREGDELVRIGLPSFEVLERFPLEARPLRVPEAGMNLVVNRLSMLDPSGEPLELIDADTGVHLGSVQDCPWSDETPHVTQANWPERISLRGRRTGHEQICDLRTGQLRERLQVGYESVHFSSDGRTLSSAGRALSTTDTRTGKVLRPAGDLKMVAAAGSGDGRTIVGIPAGRRRELVRWDFRSGEVLNRRPLSRVEGGMMHWWVTERHVVVCSYHARHVMVFDAQLNLLAERFVAGSGVNGNSVALDPTGRWLFVVMSDGGLRAWDLQATPPHQLVQAHDSYAYEVEFSPDGQRVASVGWDGWLRTWDSGTLQPLAAAELERRNLRRVAWRHDGGELAVLATTSVHFFDAVTGAASRPPLEWVPTSPRHIRGEDLDFHPSVPLLAVGGLTPSGEEGAQGVWVVDLETGAQRSFQGLGPIAWSPSGDRLLTGLGGRALQVIQYPSGDVLWTAADLAMRDINTVAWSPDGHQLAAISRPGIQVLDARSGAVIQEFTSGWSSSMDALWTLDGRRLAVGRYDGGLEFRDTADGAFIASTTRQAGYIHSLDISLDGRTIASGSGDGTLAVWRTGG